MTDEHQKLIWLAIGHKFEKYVEQIIDLFKSVPGKMSGDDSPLKNFWEEFAHQLQYERSTFYHVYEFDLRRCCQSVLDKLPNDEIELLWAGTEPEYDFSDGIGFLRMKTMRSELEDEFFRAVCQRAEGEDVALY